MRGAPTISQVEASAPEKAQHTSHAIVIGTGVAGLLAAGALTRHFDRITLLERDTLNGAEIRRGIPQARHLHGLMEGGRAIMEQLYPGLTDEMVAAGAPTTHVLSGSRWYLSGLRAKPTETGLTTLLASRALLEYGLRTRAAALPGVQIVEQTVVNGLVVTDGRVTGVQTATGTVAADLVVDATGRASRTPDWLRANGFEAPDEDSIEVDLGYASRTYVHQPEHLDGQLGVVVSTMAGRRGGGAIVLEGGRWHVTLGGMLGDHPPTDHEGFTAFAATLPVGDIHRIITDAEPIDDPVPHRFRGSLRRRYENVAGPEGLVVLGDALCSFNPLYAQGMTVAGQQALALDACLHAGRDDLPARFYAAAARYVDVAWRMSTGSDLNHPGVEGERPLRQRVLSAYVLRAHRAAHVDAKVARTFMRVANLVDGPENLLKPEMIARILWHSSRVAPLPANSTEETRNSMVTGVKS